ncbi:hypothetical protein C4G38_RS23655 [Vibrio parahaemolyticus]|uniref:hypothetical protein n=1 Tax=Vibrio vulnificus TaxID=672 RepID=UPI001DA687CC|nr:hypothetical protein [Vibrio parahaemolyticus]EJG0740405.1 hypothetical protein [Vibrio parahaemolyticus]EJG0918956.1 hypothetical protein [Vibrio parahaemolyticus]ELV8596801.1 hypothetical protein [Vibrio fluvialis]
MTNLICAFSSDSRPLYKADIYRTVNLPYDHVIHFRYKTKYIENSLLNSNSSIYNRDALVIFSIGNDLNAKNNNIKHVAIRKAKIVDFNRDEETDVCHVYMKLLGFCKATISQSNAEDILPPNKFFTPLNLELVENVSWKDCIDSINSSYPDKVFTYIKEIRDHNSQNVGLKYDSITRTSYYELIQGNRYHIDLATGNPDVNTCKIELNNSSDEIEFHCITPIESTVQFDRKIIPLTVKESTTRLFYSVLTLTPITEEIDEEGKKSDKEHNEFSTQIEIRSRQSRLNSTFFGVASASLILGLGFGRSAFKDGINWWVLLASIVLVATSAAFLHHFFNKK